jgi:hypothetical protein
MTLKKIQMYCINQTDITIANIDLLISWCHWNDNIDDCEIFNHPLKFVTHELYHMWGLPAFILISSICPFHQWNKHCATSHHIHGIAEKSLIPAVICYIFIWSLVFFVTVIDGWTGYKISMIRLWSSTHLIKWISIFNRLYFQDIMCKIK